LVALARGVLASRSLGLSVQREAAHALLVVDVGEDRRRASDATAVQRSADRGMKIALAVEGNRQDLTPNA
jgi:hypothetical protein